MLLDCEGLLLSLPLAPHHKCLPPNKQPDYDAASELNTVSYTYVLFIYDNITLYRMIWILKINEKNLNLNYYIAT